MPTLKDKRSIYDSMSQIMDIDPSKIRLQGDRCLIRDVPEEEKRGLIYIPEVCQDQERVREGIVVAVGPGDSCQELPESQHSVDSEGYVRLRRRRAKCQSCDGSGTPQYSRGFETPSGWSRVKDCIVCRGTGIEHLPMSVAPGDGVLYSRRSEAEIFILGVRYSLVLEEQSILAKLYDWTTFCLLMPPQPLRDRILVSRDAVHQKIGSLYIPQGAQEERPEGKVVATGPGKLGIDGRWKGMEVKPGDHIMFRADAGSDIKIKGERFLVMREDDVYGVLTDSNG